MNGPLVIGRILHFPTAGMRRCAVGIVSDVGETGLYATIFERLSAPRAIGPIKAGWHWPRDCRHSDIEVSWYGPKEE